MATEKQIIAINRLCLRLGHTNGVVYVRQLTGVETPFVMFPINTASLAIQLLEHEVEGLNHGAEA